MKCSQHNYLDHKRLSHLQVGSPKTRCHVCLYHHHHHHHDNDMSCDVLIILLSPMKSETMEDDNISRLALPRQDVVKPLLDVLDRHVLILPPSNLCLDLNIFLMMLFRSIFWETNPPGSFWLLRTSEDGTNVPILNEKPVLLNFLLQFLRATVCPSF